MGPYAPAGPNWQDAIREDVTRRLLAVEIECPDAGRFASRWSELLERPVEQAGEGRYRIPLDTGAINFLPGTAPEAVLAGIELESVDAAAVMAAAQARGCARGSSEVSVCGVRISLVYSIN